MDRETILRICKSLYVETLFQVWSECYAIWAEMTESEDDEMGKLLDTIALYIRDEANDKDRAEFEAKLADHDLNIASWLDDEVWAQEQAATRNG